MKKNLLCTICSVVAFLLIFASTGLSDGSVQAEQAFKKAFPNVPYDSIKPGPVKGI